MGSALAGSIPAPASFEASSSPTAGWSKIRSHPGWTSRRLRVCTLAELHDYLEPGQLLDEQMIPQDMRSKGAQARIDGIRLSAFGKGMHQPVADNSSANGRQMNRRVEVIIENRPPASR